MEPQAKPACQVKVLSYNTLIEKYSFTPNVKNDAAWRSFSWASRRQQLILKMISESPDVICLQEIRHISRFNSPNFKDFYTPLYDMGFQGVFARRNIGGEFGEQGLAIFFNRQLYTLVQRQILYFEDGTGRHALAATLRSHEGCIFTIATTHIIYPSQIETTKKQIQTLSQWSCLLQKNIPCILTGDFNLCQDVSSHKVLLAKLADRFNDSHQVMKCKKGTFSLNLTGSNCPGMIPQLMSTRIDYIFSSKDIETVSASVLGNTADLPTNAEPSDHLPVLSVFKVPCRNNLVIEDVRKLKDILSQVRERNYATNPKYQQFLDLFWLLPQSIKNAAYDLTYRKAVKLGIYEQNFQFGRIAFTNNTFHIEAIFDQEGNSKNIRWEVVKHDLIPIEMIMEIVQIIEERIAVIPQLIKLVNQLDIPAFLQKFDQKLHIESCHLIYEQVYKIANSKGRNTDHMDFGRVSFRNSDGWNVQNNIRIQAIKRLQLP